MLNGHVIITFNYIWQNESQTSTSKRKSLALTVEKWLSNWN